MTRALILLLLLSLPAAAKKGLSPYDFTLVNATGASFKEVYVSPSSYRWWDSNVLATPLADKKSVAIRFLPLTLATSWDLRVVWTRADRKPTEWHGFNLAALQKLILHYDNKSGRAWFTVTG